MSNNIKKNYIYNLSYQILSIISPLITTPYVSRVLGADGVGIYSFAFSIVTFFSLFAGLGTSPYGQREVSYRQHDRKSRTIAFWETEILSCSTVIACLIVFFVFIYCQPEYRLLYLVLSLNILAVAFDITWLFQGMEEFGKIVARNTFFKLATIVYIFLFVRTDADLLIYAIGLSAGTFLSSISLWWKLKDFVDWPVWEQLSPWKNITIVISMFLPNIAISIYTVLDKTILGLLGGSYEQNGYYEQACRISRLTLTIATSMVAVMIPRIGHYFKENNRKLMQEYMYKSFRFVLMLAMPLCCGLIGISSNMVPWFFGVGFIPVTNLLMVLALLIPAVGLSNVAGVQYLIPTQRQNSFTVILLAGAICDVILNLCLIPDLKSMGAAVSSVITEWVITALSFYYIRKELSIKCIIIMVPNYLISSLMMMGVILALGFLLPPSMSNTFILIAIGAMTYLIGLFLMKDVCVYVLVDIFRQQLAKIHIGRR